MNAMSEPQRQTTRQSSPAEQDASTSRQSYFGAAGERPAVLLVDDTPGNLLALEGMLRRDDIEILSAKSGPAALEILLERDVALAIVDVQMPEMDGFELASLMRGVERTRYVPIIFVTAGSRDEARVFKGYEAGAVDYLFKPIDGQVLRGKVDVFVTLEKQRQKLRDADRMREMFIAVLGHDLRSPLNGMYMAAQLLLRRSESGESRDLVQRILRNSKRMGRMIEQLLDATHFRVNGSVSLAPERADLERLASEIVGEFENARDRIRLDVRGDTVGSWDVDRLMQILTNVVGNAARHSPPESPILIQVDGEHEHTVELRVQNGGPPIPEEVQRAMFEPFRSPNLRRRGGEGLGLGLYITHQLVQAHGGTISVESNHDMGTCITMVLPRHVKPSGQTGKRKPDANPSPG